MRDDTGGEDWLFMEWMGRRAAFRIRQKTVLILEDPARVGEED